MKNIGRTLFDINHNISFYSPPRVVKKKKKDKNIGDPIKLKRFFTAKGTLNKMKI